MISEADRNAVLAEAASSGKTAERVLVERGHLPERELLDRYAEVTGCELFDLDEYPIDPEAAALIPEVVARHCGLLAVGYHGEMLAVAMSDPQNLDVVRALEAFADRPYIALATRSDVLRALDRLARD
jgi:MSHA biogenesis protein MshE